jgi:hypothetical protein
MKRVVLSMVLLLSMVLPTYAVTVSIDSSIEVTNAPANSKWQVECGTSTGVYILTRQFTMVSGNNIVPVSSIFLSGGNWFCRTNFVQPYGQGPYSTELPVTITVPSLVAPALTVIP